jgi:hypothetical protein
MVIAICVMGKAGSAEDTGKTVRLLAIALIAAASAKVQPCTFV